MLKELIPYAAMAIGAAMILRRERCPMEVIFGFILILMGFGTHC